RLDLRRRADVHTLGRRRVDHDGAGAVAPGQQQLRQRSPEGVAHDDRRAVEALDDALDVLDDPGNGLLGDHLRVLPQRLDLDLEAGVGGGQDPVALLLVVGDPVLPAAGGHPQPMDENDGFRHCCHLAFSAALTTRSLTSSGCDIIATCDEVISTVVAPIRWAMNRSVAGGMVLSLLATMYQDGIVRHAGTPDGCTRMVSSAGRWL